MRLVSMWEAASDRDYYDDGEAKPAGGAWSTCRICGRLVPGEVKTRAGEVLGPEECPGCGEVVCSRACGERCAFLDGERKDEA